jgi:hypothetical protein
VPPWSLIALVASTISFVLSIGLVLSVVAQLLAAFPSAGVVFVSAAGEGWALGADGEEQPIADRINAIVTAEI